MDDLARSLEQAAARLLRAVILRALADASGADNPRIGCCSGSDRCEVGPAHCALSWIRSHECRQLCRSTGVPHRELVRLATSPRRARDALTRGTRRYL